ncbi:hypothetical protein V499_08202 [Pseudogymnoascus sp. VKM F-103]|nr:hypothetical protein V499_08202 [Pseudogymnoascus sp. VKM F-103]
MIERQENDRLRSNGNNYAKKGATSHIESPPPRNGKQEQREPPKIWNSRPKQLDSDFYRSKSSRSRRKRDRSRKPSVDAGSMASAENEVQTSNTSMSEGHQEPPSDVGALEQDKLSLTGRFGCRDHVDDNPTTPDLSAQPTTSGQNSHPLVRPIAKNTVLMPIRPEKQKSTTLYYSGAATPNPIHPGGLESRNKHFGVSPLLQPTTTEQHVASPILEHNTASTGPLHTASLPERISENGGAGGGIVGGSKPTSNGIPVAEPPVEDDFDIILPKDTNFTDDDCNESSELGWLCIQGRKKGEFMELTPLIPHSLSSVEPPKVLIKPSKTEVQRVQQLRRNVRRRRRDIQNQKLLLQAKDKQISAEIEETFKRLREFAAERHKNPKVHDSRLELALRLFSESRSGRDECGPLNDELSSLEEALEFEEIQLTQAEDSLYEGFGIPPMESGEDQEDNHTMKELPLPQSSPISESGHNSASHIGEAKSENDDSDYDAYSTGSFEQYRKNYHPLYIEYQENRGSQDNLYERRAYIMEDKGRLEDQQESRHQFGLTLLEDDQKYLDSLPEVLRLLDIEIDGYRVEIEQLRAQCLEQGIIDEADNYMDGDREDSNVYDDSDDSDDSTPIPPPLPAPAPPKPALPTPPPQINITSHAPSSMPISCQSIIVSNLGTRLDDQSYQNRINPWLFGKLAASRTELTLLATILSAMGAEPDIASHLDVLKLWDHDGAGAEPPKRPENLDEETLNRLRRVTREVVGDGFDRALVSSLFGLSLWGGEAYGASDETTYLDDI